VYTTAVSFGPPVKPYIAHHTCKPHIAHHARETYVANACEHDLVAKNPFLDLAAHCILGK